MRIAATLVVVSVLAGGFTAARAAPMILEVIPLQHRTLDDVIPVVEPLLVEGGTVTGMNNQLVVKTTPANLDEIKQLLATIDRELRRLLITVKQDVGSGTEGSEQALSGRYTPGNLTLESEDRARRARGTSVTLGDEDGDHAKYRTLDRISTGDDRNSFRVQTVEGQAAFIQAGLSIPVPQQNVTLHPGGVTVQDTVEFRDATSGFYVLPRLNGDRVTLLVSPHMSRVVPGRVPSFEIQNVETTASGRLGEWIAIGGIDQSRVESAQENLTTSRRHSAEERDILIKVDEIP